MSGRRAHVRPEPAHARSDSSVRSNDRGQLAAKTPGRVDHAGLAGLQGSIGNRAVGRLMANRNPETIRRVETGLIEGLDKDDPSTYDTGGGHSYKDHGAHTTAKDHIIRVKTGVAPSGRSSRVPSGKPSSKFASDDKHKQAFNAALTALKEKNKNKQKVKGAANVIALAGAGHAYYEDGDKEEGRMVDVDKVQLDIVPASDTTIKINSMYPVP